MAHVPAGWSKMLKKKGAEGRSPCSTLAPASSITRLLRTMVQLYPKTQKIPIVPIENTIVDEPKSASGPSLGIASRERQLTHVVQKTRNRAHSPSYPNCDAIFRRWSDNVMEGIHMSWYFDASKHRASVRSELDAPPPRPLSLSK